MKQLRILLISAFITPMIAHAWDNGGVDTFIEDITVQQNGTFYIYAKHDLCDGGAINKVGYVYDNTTLNGGVVQNNEGTKMMLSTALSAHMAGKQVRVYADDSGTGWGCKMGAIKIFK
jgi:hypothetical protein